MIKIITFTLVLVYGYILYSTFKEILIKNIYRYKFEPLGIFIDLLRTLILFATMYILLKNI